MPTDDCKPYHARRAAEAHARAEAAQNPSIAAIHSAMAEEYERLAQGEDNGLRIVEQ